jgi:hypothetical protein
MARLQFMFYATALDLSSVLTALESAKPLQYTATGLFKVGSPQTYLSHAKIPDFGCAIHPTAVANPTYLTAIQGTHIHSQAVPQKSGGTLFAIDQMENSDTITFRPGGRFGNASILCGMIGTVSESPVSRDLYKFIAQAFRKRFAKRQEFLVGPEALRAWNSGTRLTIGALSSDEFELKRT